MGAKGKQVCGPIRPTDREQAMRRARTLALLAAAACALTSTSAFLLPLSSSSHHARTQVGGACESKALID